MSTRTTMMLQIATSGLTGHRERDIAYLKEQIRDFSSDEQTVAVLKNIISGLAGPGMSSAAA